MDEYAEMVKDLTQRCYTHVSRYTTSAFMRLKLGEPLERRGVAAHIFETQQEAISSVHFDGNITMEHDAPASLPSTRVI